MEAVAEKINNALSHSKESIPITITGRITSKDGTFIERLEEPLQLDENANYHVYLNDFTGWSNVPNVTEHNRHFYCTWKKPGSEPSAPGTASGHKIERIKFPISTQSVDTYSDFLESVFIKRDAFWTDPADKTKKIVPVKFTYDLTVMRVVMHIYTGCTVDFKEGTWYSELGFEKKVYEAGVHLAPHLADIVKSLNILVKTNLSLDWRFRGKRTNILYNIINNVPAGQMLTEKPNPVKRVVLSNKKIQEIVLQFVTEDDIPIHFGNEEFVLTLVIERM